MLSVFLLSFIGFALSRPLNESKWEPAQLSASHTTVKRLIKEDREKCVLKDQCPILTPSIHSTVMPCKDGKSGEYECSNVDLLAFISLYDLGCVDERNCAGNDIWGWTDPLTGEKYVMAGTTIGTSFVRVTNPTNPVVVGWMPSNNPTSTVWRDMKVLNNFVYIVADRSRQYMQYFDLTKLRDVTTMSELKPTGVFEYDRVGGTGNTHNIVINERATGDKQRAYLVGNNGCAGGLYAVDISVPDSPQPAGCFSADGYTHDAECVTYHGPDVRYLGKEICFGYNENTLTIVDFENINEPVMLSRTGYAGASYTHQGWLSEDQQYLFMDDELDEVRGTAGNNGRARTYIWDVSDLQNPKELLFYENEKVSVDHNLYVRGDYIYESNYESGLRVMKGANKPVSEDGKLLVKEVAFFDTFPEGNTVTFNGAWSNYPFFKYPDYEADGSVVVAVQDINRGLFLLAVNGLDAEASQSKVEHHARERLSQRPRDMLKELGQELRQEGSRLLKKMAEAAHDLHN